MISRFTRWMAKHRSALITTVSSAVVVALVVAIAIVSGGYTAQRLSLNDSSVWVANGAQQFIGRANTEVLELNTVVASEGADIDVVQAGETVLLVDRSGATVEIVDPATSTIADSVPLPPEQPEVYLAGANVVIFASGTGEVWVLPRLELASFDAAQQPVLVLGAESVLSVDQNGLLFAFSPRQGRVFEIDAAVSTAVRSTESSALDATSGDFSITSVGGRWVVLDAGQARLDIGGTTVDLSQQLGGSSEPVLQLPSITSDSLLIGHSQGLLRVGLDGATVTEIEEGLSGAAAAPLVVDGCEFAAWSNGQVWRDCTRNEGGDGERITLEGMTGSPRLAFADNGDRVVLNDTRGGASWAVQSNGELIDNWDDLITVVEDEQQLEENDEDTPPETEKTQLPPVAVDDDFGARPGRSSVLPVLLNDYDPNGDVLVIDSVTELTPAVGRLDLIASRQQVQLTLDPEATGSVSFGYTISDGRGGTASATVQVAIRSEGENSPPVQVRTTRSSVEAGSQIAVPVLGDWVDPDGDPFYLASASVGEPDTVSYKLDGTVNFTADAASDGLASVALVVSDGTAETTGTLSVTVRPSGEVPIIADPFVVLAYAGQEITVDPLLHVRGGSDALRLNSVPEKAGVTISPSYETGTFRLLSDQVRTHYLEYVVTDGDQTATGLVRVDVAAPPDGNLAPITIPKTIYVQTLRNERIDVAGTDIDPAGGVLLVTGTMNIPVNSGVRAEILEQRIVRVSLDRPLDSGPVTFNYRISNGLAEAEGTITVVEVAPPTSMQPPIANDDTITVRQGAAITIPVLANDEHPDGEELSLSHTLAQELPDDAGLLFASGNQLRYLAPTRTGNFTAVYEVTGPDGQAARASLRIEVREPDVSTNKAPIPETVTARVLAGQSVSILIPLSGIDPDGDTVQLLGQETNPEKGLVQGVEGDRIEYVAGDYSAGTDSFTYTVIDALGARATGTVRIGISPRLDGARNPVAIRDEVTVRPGVTVAVQVLANDSDPDGSPLTVVSAEPNDSVTTAEIDDNVVRITPPRTPGEYGVIYEIENETGGSSRNFVTVTVAEDAPLAYPAARDTVLTLADVLERDTVDVDVLANVFFADGRASQLGVSLHPGYATSAEVLPNKRVRVEIGNASQIIPFRVTHPDDARVFSYAFIWVPGYDDALPQIDTRAPALRVNSEDALRIDLNEHVISISGRDVRLTDTSTVRATHSNGDNLVVNSGTLVFTSADKYFGPASISFEVTDGTSANDPNGRKAILVLPITVDPRDNQPPVFGGAVIDFEPGQEKTIDLLRLTNYPYDDDIDELAYSALQPAPVGFTYTLNGQSLVLRADESARKGTTTALSLGVRDDLSEGTAGRIQLNVVASTRPLASPSADNAVTERGRTTTIDVLANDQATNPFPNRPLTVVDIRGIDGSSLPAGVTVTPSADKRTLTATIAATAEPVDINLQYQVADATNDPDRFVWGTVRISIQDRPDPVTAVRVTEFGDKRLTVVWNSAAANNSPITGYDVTLTRVSGGVVGITSCAGSQCSVTTPGNGADSAVRISVVAKNSIGASDPAAMPGTTWSDVVPPAPTDLQSQPRDGGLHITWKKPADSGVGSAITSYVITVGGVAATVTKAASDPVGTTYSYDRSGLSNGSAVAFSVSARNDAQASIANWNSATGTGYPAGAPLRSSTPVAIATVEDGTSATLTWAPFGANGRTISNYYAAVFTGAAPSCTVDGTLPGTAVPPSGAVNVGTNSSANFSGLTANTTYSFIVFAFNGMGCTDSAVVQATPRARPGAVTSFTTSALPEANGSNVWDYRVTGLSVASGEADSLMYRLSGAGVDSTVSGPIPIGAFVGTGNGSHYGADVSIEVLACKQYETLLCANNWSPLQSLGMPVRNDDLGGRSFVLTVDGGALSPDTSEYRWTSSPLGAYSSVTYSCDGGGTQTSLAPGAGGACAVTETGLFGGNYESLVITITANGTAYTRTYTPSNF